MLGYTLEFPALGSTDVTDVNIVDLDGNAIMELLNIPAGPQVGKAWTFLKELRLDRGPLERDEAEAELLKWWATQQG